MIRRPLVVALAFAVSALVLFGALVRITAMTLALERSERTALERATHEENIRIALWRLDATLAELIALENTRPASRFHSAAEPAGLLLLGGVALAADDRVAAGPGLAPLVRSRFEIGADGKLRADPPLTAPVWLAALPMPEQPKIEAPPRRPLSRPRQAANPQPESSRPVVQEPEPAPRAAPPEDTVEPVAQNAAQQNTQRAAVPSPVQQQNPQQRQPANSQMANSQMANQQLPPAPTQQTVPPAALQNTSKVQLDRINVGGNESGKQSAYTQEALNVLSFQRRKELGEQNNFMLSTSEPAGVDVESAFEGRWLGGDLVLLRRIRRGDARLLQGTWVDWPALRALLLTQVEPVVPASSLEPLGEADEADPGRRLALLPARLVPGPMPETEPRDWTPVRLSLAAAWMAALLGLVGVGSLLKGSVTLSQRRADFVSAVTHELRTPLTTFRLYTDMLLDGVVPAEERPSYLATLKREADRLGHLVENVLVFSRLERRAAAMRVESLSLADLLARVTPRLTERAAQAGLTLQVETATGVEGERVRVEVASVEQILLNLVDNACKYAPNPTNPVLHLGAARQDRHAVLGIHDHGPGIEPRERRRIFRPFHRPASQAAGSAPGVGLGLALSRRLARRMGGDLRLAAAGEGASFELWLPRSKP
jgi:signal transduction histidine kinase